MHIHLKKIPILLFFISLFIYTAIINSLYPQMVDDFYYSLHFSSIADAISQVFSTTKLLYLTWSGRISAYFAMDALLPFITLFNLLNAAIFCLLINGIFLTTTLRAPNKLRDLATLIFITTIAWFCIIELAEASFWKVGAFFYLWPMTATLYFIYPFLKLFTNQPINISGWLKIIAFSLAALLLGIVHESLNITILIFLLFINIYCWRRYKKIPTWVISSSIFYFIGVIILVIAPGNYVRAHSIAAAYPHITSIGYYIKKFITLNQSIGTHLSQAVADSIPLGVIAMLTLLLLIGNGYIKNKILSIAVALLAVLAAYVMSKQAHIHVLTGIIIMIPTIVFIVLLFKNYKNNPRGLLFFILSFISAYTMMGVPHIMSGDRTSFFPDIFLVMCLTTIFSQEYSKKFWQWLYPIIAAICLAALVISMTSTYFNIRLFHNQFQKRVQLMMLYKNNKVNNVILPPYHIPAIDAWRASSGNKALLIRTKNIYISDLSATDPADWRNRSFAKYYGFPAAKITIKPVALWSDIEQELSIAQKNQNSNTFIKDNNLFWVYNAGSCSSLPNKQPVSIHIYPSNVNNLSKDKRKQGFENFELKFTPDYAMTIISANGQIDNQVCVLTKSLPGYKIKRIEVNQ
ncbi:MAG TPA: DUF6056 family protein [Gammaproteobacteria bacterium]|nr:DUF6056 family protein [Gammaproteobacteria bacterium]